MRKPASYSPGDRDESGRLVCPPTVNAAGRKLWHATVYSYEVDKFRAAHVPLLVALVDAHELRDKAAAQVEKDGAFIPGRDGVREHPGVRTKRRAEASITSLSAKLGLSNAAGHHRREHANRHRTKHHLEVFDRMTRDGINVARLKRDREGRIRFHSDLFDRYPDLFFMTPSDVTDYLREIKV
ncbi:P27 family phage terminase small subunit [Paraburkholderia sp.]|uniref:P27 family phage terminase small subunit n=1 Tax=Paraburkholderia sp. TaxID=1926495 RepID=UPI0039E5B859